jgi:hypothetical protein
VTDRLADAYRRFADEARGRLALYVELAERVAEDRELLALLSELPLPKQQPNLLLAAVRRLCGTPGGWSEFRECVDARRDEVLELVRTRRTQTNEPARCATLLPLLETVPEPVASTDPHGAAIEWIG